MNFYSPNKGNLIINIWPPHKSSCLEIKYQCVICLKFHAIYTLIDSIEIPYPIDTDYFITFKIGKGFKSKIDKRYYLITHGIGSEMILNFKAGTDILDVFNNTVSIIKTIKSKEHLITLS